MGTTVPNPNGVETKVGDLVEIKTGEWAGYVGEIVSFVEDGKNWIQQVKIVKQDGTVTVVEVTNLVVSFVAFAEKVIGSNVFQKFWGWFTGLFKKKQPK